jgi:methionine-rich copper-binding protein CopC
VLGKRCWLTMPGGRGPRAAAWPGPRSRGRRPSPWARLVLTLLLGGAVGCVVATPAAAADNELVVTVPDIREQVDRPPGFVTMAFSEPVDPSLAKMLVQDPSGANVTTGGLIVEGTNLSSQLADGLDRGTYTVTYRLARPDGEPQGGTFQFSYGPGTFSDAADRRWSGAAEEPGVLKNEDPNAVSPSPGEPSSSRSAETSPSAAPSTTGSPSLTPSASTSAPPSPTPGAGPSGPSGTLAPSPSPIPTSAAGPSLPAVLAAVLGVALVGGATALVLRRRRTRRAG